MNTKLTIAFIGIIVIGLIAVVYWRGPEAERMTDDSMIEPQESAINESTTTQAIPLTGTASLASLFGSGQDLICDVVYDQPSGGSVASTVYLDGEHMRTDSEMMMGSEIYQSHTIYDGDMMYSWNVSSVGSNAVKFKVTKNDLLSEATSSDEEQSVNLTQEVRYDCQPWSVDAGLFTPPTDIDFMDMEDMMHMMPGDPNSHIEVQ